MLALSIAFILQVLTCWTCRRTRWWCACCCRATRCVGAGGESQEEITHIYTRQRLRTVPLGLPSNAIEFVQHAMKVARQ